MPPSTTQANDTSASSTMKKGSADPVVPATPISEAVTGKFQELEAAVASVSEDEAADLDEEDGEHEEDEEDVTSVQDALVLIDEGVALIRERNYTVAADQLSRAVGTMAALYGDGAPECARAMHLYGIALYNLAVERSAIFGSSEHEQQNAALDPDAMEAATAAIAELMKKGADRFAFSGDASITGEDTAEPAGPATANGADSEDGEQQGDLELAYEVLCVAEKGYKAVESTDNKKGLAEVYLYLGHYHLESERHAEARDEYKKSLDLKLSLLPAGHRELAEVRFQYAIALEVLGQYDLALEQVRLASEDLTTRLDSVSGGAITKDVKGKQPAQLPAGNATSFPTEDEIKDLIEMKRDLESKIEEITLKMHAATSANAGLAAGIESAFDSPAATPVIASVPAGPIADISGLVRKRKVPVDSPVPSVEGSTPSKKAKSELE
ncbi:hypothetical protein HKX48_004842 [Thoreauomyces humboldtii]|nr:hypothetical protein HKX48_004842 [Thoreauomyces humboldtii]